MFEKREPIKRTSSPGVSSWFSPVTKSQTPTLGSYSTSHAIRSLKMVFPTPPSTSSGSVWLDPTFWHPGPQFHLLRFGTTGGQTGLHLLCNLIGPDRVGCHPLCPTSGCILAPLMCGVVHAHPASPLFGAIIRHPEMGPRTTGALGLSPHPQQKPSIPTVKNTSSAPGTFADLMAAASRSC